MEQTNRGIIGIDVSKDKLDVWLLSEKRHYVIKNREGAIAEWLSELGEPTLIEKIVLEPTGGYEKQLVRLLVKFGFKTHIAHSLRVYHFGQSKGLFAKTDKIDARMLALYGEQEKTEPNAEKKEKEYLLKELGRRHQQLVEGLTIEKLRLKDHLSLNLKASINRQIEHLTQEIKLIREEIEEVIKKDKEQSEVAETLETFKGVGRQSACLLIAMLPELGKVKKAEIAALTGLAPKNKDSGRKQGYRKIQGGRFHVRRMLYMIALVAIRYNPKLKTFYNNLRERGKKGKVALVAVMRKVVITLNAMIKNKTIWQPI